MDYLKLELSLRLNEQVSKWRDSNPESWRLAQKYERNFLKAVGYCTDKYKIKDAIKKIEKGELVKFELDRHKRNEELKEK